jgi:predicted dehydrogenase
MFKGSKGVLVADFNTRMLIPVGRYADLTYYKGAQTRIRSRRRSAISRSSGINACKGDRPEDVVQFRLQRTHDRADGARPRGVPRRQAARVRRQGRPLHQRRRRECAAQATAYRASGWPLGTAETPLPSSLPRGRRLTPPQWHALQLVAAVGRGLDVYCEKPLSFEVREGRAMVDAAARSGRIVQVGFQRRQSPAFRAVKQFLAEGGLGRVVQAEAQIFYTAGTVSNTPQPPPASLDWDRWCGPGPLLPYSPQVAHRSWRLEKTSGQGHLYDWGIHLIDAARVILGETAPHTVSASGGLFHLQGKITTPDTLTAQFEFARCPLTWRHRLWGSEEHTPEVNNGIFLYGEKGTVFVTDARWSFTPRGKAAERKVHEAKADMGLLHMTEFLDCVRSRRPAPCTVADAHLSTTIVKLGVIAYETGARLRWDAAKEEIVGNPAAASLLRRHYRAPWVHPLRA